MAKGRTYHCKLVVDDRHVQTFIDGQLINDVVITPTVIEPMYTNMTYNRNTNQYYFKAVNVTGQPKEITVDSERFANGSVYQLSGRPDAENHLGANNQIERQNVPILWSSTHFAALFRQCLSERQAIWNPLVERKQHHVN